MQQNKNEIGDRNRETERERRRDAIYYARYPSYLLLTIRNVT